MTLRLIVTSNEERLAAAVAELDAYLEACGYVESDDVTECCFECYVQGDVDEMRQYNLLLDRITAVKAGIL